MNQKLAVIFGAGTMGQGIAQAIALSGCEVLMIEDSKDRLETGVKKIDRDLDREIARWGLTQSEKRATLGRISTSTNRQDAEKADFVIEAIHEILSNKQDLFFELDKICKPETIIMSNSATLAISEIAARAKYPERMITMHFLNPAPKTPVVEISRGIKTDDRTYEGAIWFANMMRKTPITVYESPGSITTRVALPMINQAVKVLEEGIASCESIDRALKLGFGLNIGPFALADKIGVDSLLYWMENLYRDTFDQAFVPAALFRKMVRAGYKGIKVGRGFYAYQEDGQRIENSGLSLADMSAATTQKGARLQ